MRRRSNRITMFTVAVTVCVLATSITVIAAPMKQDSGVVSAKVSLPKAGISRVVSDYVQTADEAEISVLAADVFKSASAKDFKVEQKETTAVETAEAVVEEETAVEAEPQAAVSGLASVEEAEPIFYEEPVYEEPVYVEPVYEEPVYEEPVYVEPVYEEPVYEEPVYEEPVYEEPVYEEPVYEEPVYEEPVYEEPVYEEPVYEEPEGEYWEEETETYYEEQTLEEFWEEQDQRLREEAEQSEQAPEDTSGEYLGQIIANDACSYVGVTPYVWAGCSLETGTDCSGFTMLIYAKYGYELSHDSNVQSCQGRSVSVSEALPGDIVVYPGHVAMYIGNGQIVHCPQPGEYVTIISMYYTTPLDVRRIIN